MFYDPNFKLKIIPVLVRGLNVDSNLPPFIKPFRYIDAQKESDCPAKINEAFYQIGNTANLINIFSNFFKPWSHIPFRFRYLILLSISLIFALNNFLWRLAIGNIKSILLLFILCTVPLWELALIFIDRHLFGIAYIVQRNMTVHSHILNN